MNLCKSLACSGLDSGYITAFFFYSYCDSNSVRTYQRGGERRSHHHLKANALKQSAEKRAVFDQVK